MRAAPFDSRRADRFRCHFRKPKAGADLKAHLRNKSSGAAQILLRGISGDWRALAVKSRGVQLRVKRCKGIQSSLSGEREQVREIQKRRAGNKPVLFKGEQRTWKAHKKGSESLTGARFRSGASCSLTVFNSEKFRHSVVLSSLRPERTRFVVVVDARSCISGQEVASVPICRDSKKISESRLLWIPKI